MRKKYLAIGIALWCLLFVSSPTAYAAPEIQTSGAGLVSKVAPSELLPISVKLLNFGNQSTVDVTVSYRIVDAAGTPIYAAHETVAVETTATFVKVIQIPYGTKPGQYRAQSSIAYRDQVAPATTEFPFTVERKLFGLFQSELYLYGGLLALISIVVAMATHASTRRRATRQTPLDYSNVPGDQRTFYEILSDIVMQMRSRVGDDALIIASRIDGLTIDGATGRVLALAGQPSKVIATLVFEYERFLGKRVSFSFRPK